jgi:hypothetical protein
MNREEKKSEEIRGRQTRLMNCKLRINIDSKKKEQESRYSKKKFSEHSSVYICE